MFYGVFYSKDRHSKATINFILLYYYLSDKKVTTKKLRNGQQDISKNSRSR